MNSAVAFAAIRFDLDQNWPDGLLSHVSVHCLFDHFFDQKPLQQFPFERVNFRHQQFGIVRDVLALDELIHSESGGHTHRWRSKGDKVEASLKVAITKP